MKIVIWGPEHNHHHRHDHYQFLSSSCYVKSVRCLCGLSSPSYCCLEKCFQPELSVNMHTIISIAWSYALFVFNWLHAKIMSWLFMVCPPIAHGSDHSRPCFVLTIQGLWWPSIVCPNHPGYVLTYPGWSGWMDGKNMVCSYHPLYCIVLIDLYSASQNMSLSETFQTTCSIDTVLS